MTLARIKAWIRARLPTWAQLTLLSRTYLGGFMGVIGFAAERSDEIRSLLSAMPFVKPWHVQAVGLALIFFARYRDAITGQNPA